MHMRLVELEGSDKTSIISGLLQNRRSLEEWMRPCEDICFVCDKCRAAMEILSRILMLDRTRVFVILSSRGFAIGGMWFLDNEFHGHAWDGRLLNKTKIVKEALDEIKKVHGSVVINVPTDSMPIAEWAEKRIGFRFKERATAAWEDGDRLLDVVTLEY